MYKLYIKPYADKIFKKLAKKDKQSLVNIYKKIKQIQNNPQNSYKFLKFPLQSYNRVHLNKSFVLVFQILHEERIIEIWAYEHHDVVYCGKWVG